MTVTVARNVISCKSCGSNRVVTDRHARRARQQGGISCVRCRGGGSLRHQATEEAFRFWLRSYGVQVPKGESARAYIAAGGAPPELVELARSVYPPGDAIVNA